MKMKELLHPMAVYNSWANQQLTDVILKLPEEKQHAVIPSSFDSLHKTILHLWDAESIWWQRLHLQEHIIVPGAGFEGTTEKAINGLLQQSKQWEGWLLKANELSLDHVFHYLSKKSVTKMKVYEMLQHIFNHGSYHRGQLVTMLRQVGVEKIPQTDFSYWNRAVRNVSRTTR